MSKAVLRTAVALVVLVALVALPAGAGSLTIKRGKDFWTTPNNSRTVFTFPKGEVEALCDATATEDPIKVTLRGVPITDAKNADTIVARLDNATFVDREASTRIQVQALQFASAASVSTPCGDLDFTVGLGCKQAVTVMKLVQTSDKGGTFTADLSVSVEFKAFKGSTYIGSLFYNMLLPNPEGGTAWTLGDSGEFLAGMDDSKNCIDVLREKLLGYDESSSHFYWISDMISKKDCSKRG